MHPHTIDITPNDRRIKQTLMHVPSSTAGQLYDEQSIVAFDRSYPDLRGHTFSQRQALSCLVP
jgi:hypothetical protein